jgi:hypothetical protein
MVDEMAEPPSHIGWIRAILTAAAIAVVGTAILVYGTNAVLTKVHGLNRHTRVGLATALFFIALFAIAWVLRWFQRRHAI